MTSPGEAASGLRPRCRTMTCPSALTTDARHGCKHGAKRSPSAARSRSVTLAGPSAWACLACARASPVELSSNQAEPRTVRPLRNTPSDLRNPSATQRCTWPPGDVRCWCSSAHARLAARSAQRPTVSANPRVRRHDGAWRVLGSQALPPRKPQGRGVGAIGSYTDLTNITDSTGVTHTVHTTDVGLAHQAVLRARTPSQPPRPTRCRFFALAPSRLGGPRPWRRCRAVAANVPWRRGWGSCCGRWCHCWPGHWLDRWMRPGRRRRRVCTDPQGGCSGDVWAPRAHSGHCA